MIAAQRFSARGGRVREVQSGNQRSRDGGRDRGLAAALGVAGVAALPGRTKRSTPATRRTAVPCGSSQCAERRGTVNRRSRGPVGPQGPPGRTDRGAVRAGPLPDELARSAVLCWTPGPEREGMVSAVHVDMRLGGAVLTVQADVHLDRELNRGAAPTLASFRLPGPRLRPDSSVRAGCARPLRALV